MLKQELLRPWALLALTLFSVAVLVVLIDRERTPPGQYQKWVNPTGIPAEEGNFFSKHGFDVDSTAKGPLEDVSLIRREYEYDLPPLGICEEPNCESNVLALTPADIRVIDDMCASNRDALDKLYESLRGSTASAPREFVTLRNRIDTWQRADFGKQILLNHLLSYDMLRCTLQGDGDGAVLAVETKYKVLDKSPHGIAAAEVERRLNQLQNAFNDVVVLANRMDLNTGQWSRLVKIAAKPRDYLVSEARMSFEFEAMEGLGAYEWNLFFPYRRMIRQSEESYWLDAMPRFSIELVEQSVADLAGITALDKAAMAVFARDNAAAYEPVSNVLFRNDANRRSLRLGGARGLYNDAYQMHAAFTPIPAAPSLVRAAAAVSRHRQLHGAFPTSLAEVGPESYEAVGVIGDLNTLLKDPYGEGMVKYRPTDNGAMVYSVGRNGFDHFDPDTKRGQELNEFQKSTDDIRFTLRPVAAIGKN